MAKNLIEEELNAAKKFLLSQKDGRVVLTRENVAMVEAMIMNDSDYSRSSDVNAVPSDEKFISTAVSYWLYGEGEIDSDKSYKGSTAYWMTELKKVLESKNTNDEKLKRTILLSVLAVDRENSTHITSDSVGPRILTERIFKHRKTLLEELKNRKKGFKLIIELSAETLPEGGRTIGDKHYNSRKNFSFATKFCHYACFYFFSGTPEQDNYSIYDGVVAKALPLYAKKGKKAVFKYASEYEDYSDLIDRLRGDKISRNGFDHLLWYYHKARLDDIDKILKQKY